MWRSSGVGEYAAGEQHGLFLDRLAGNLAARRPVYYCHGFTDRGGADSVEVHNPAELRAITAAGLPVVACDLAGTPGGINAWGNDSSRDKIDTARAFMVARFGLRDDRILLLTQSMGAAPAAAYAKAHPDRVAGAVLIAPGVNIGDLYANNRAGVAASIATAYGGGPPDAAHDPIQYAAQLAVPLMVIYSTTDDLCLPEFSIAFAQAAGAQLVSEGAVGHGNAGVVQSQVVDYLFARSQ